LFENTIVLLKHIYCRFKNMHKKCHSVKPFFDIWAGKEKPKDSENAKKIKRTIFVKFKSILI
jgi:hypothetical protein